MSDKRNKQDKRLADRAKQRAAATGGASDSADAIETLDPPFGYRLEGGEQVGDEAETAVVERMRALGDKRLGIDAIAKKLNDEELLARGNPWTGRAVARVLRRRVDKIASR
jgi:hypothetical protein